MKIKCLNCNETIESKYRHNLVSCKCENCYVDGGQDYLHFGGKDYTLPGVYSQMLSTIDGCDSLCELQLSSIEHHDTSLCEADMPLAWRGGYFPQGGADTLSLRCRAGTDSIVVLHVSVRQYPVSQLAAEPFCEDGG